MIDKNLVKNIAEKFLGTTTSYLVDVIINPGNIIVVEIDNDTGVCIDDCIRLSKFIESQLDRDVEDYELEVGSTGISQPFKTVRQYQKNITHEVEILTTDGRKLYGTLKDADNDGFIVSIEKRIKPEGAKRKITVTDDLRFTYGEVKYTKYKF
jgi:ribosome maturation factor RimP